MRVSNRPAPLAAVMACVAVVACSSSAHGQTFGGTTAGQLTFNRPVSLTALSATGTAVPYLSLPFTVDTTGTYTFTSTSFNTAPENYDGYLLLYNGAFNPATPLANLLAGDDDFDPDAAGPLAATGGSQITTSGTPANSYGAPGSLTAGAPYVLVQTGFNNTDFGTFTGVATGAGLVAFAPVPEPGAVLGVATLAGIAAARLRRRRAVVAA